jgi:hypothetical protein
MAFVVGWLQKFGFSSDELRAFCSARGYDYDQKSARVRAVVDVLKEAELAKTPAARQALIIERLELDGFTPRAEEFVLEATRRLDKAGLGEDAIRAWSRTQNFELKRNWLS